MGKSSEFFAGYFATQVPASEIQSIIQDYNKTPRLKRDFDKYIADMRRLYQEFWNNAARAPNLSDKQEEAILQSVNKTINESFTELNGQALIEPGREREVRDGFQRVIETTKFPADISQRLQQEASDLPKKSRTELFQFIQELRSDIDSIPGEENRRRAEKKIDKATSDILIDAFIPAGGINDSYGFLAEKRDFDRGRTKNTFQKLLDRNIGFKSTPRKFEQSVEAAIRNLGVAVRANTGEEKQKKILQLASFQRVLKDIEKKNTKTGLRRELSSGWNVPEEFFTDDILSTVLKEKRGRGRFLNERQIENLVEKADQALLEGSGLTADTINKELGITTNLSKRTKVKQEVLDEFIDFEDILGPDDFRA